MNEHPLHQMVNHPIEWPPVWSWFMVAAMALIFGIIWLLPVIIACYRNHPCAIPIAILTFALGPIGWWGALVWASMPLPKPWPQTLLGASPPPLPPLDDGTYQSIDRLKSR